MKKKTPATRNRLDAKIRQAKSLDDKLGIIFYGEGEERRSAATVLVRDWSELASINIEELQQRLQREQKAGKISVNTEAEYCALLSAHNRLVRFAFAAMREWKPERFEQIAKVMRRVSKGKIYNNVDQADAILRARIICSRGKVNAAELAKEFFPRRDIDDAVRQIHRIKARLFPKSSADS